MENSIKVGGWGLQRTVLPLIFFSKTLEIALKSLKNKLFLFKFWWGALLIGSRSDGTLKLQSFLKGSAGNCQMTLIKRNLIVGM